jgi:hypothetical protein
MIHNEFSKTVQKAKEKIKSQKSSMRRMQTVVSKGVSNDLIRKLAASVLERATAIQKSISTGNAKEKLLQMTQGKMGWDLKSNEGKGKASDSKKNRLAKSGSTKKKPTKELEKKTSTRSVKKQSRGLAKKAHTVKGKKSN